MTAVTHHTRPVPPPAGDLGVLIETLVARVQLRLAARPAPDHGDGHDAGSAEESLRWSARLND